MKVIGFIFAAGFGTRLKPYTNSKPKALVKIDGKTLIDNAINKLVENGIKNIIVNVHHFSDLIIKHIRNNNYDAKIFISDERAYLRETAGGLKFAIPFWDNYDAILLYNVDILSNINLRQLIDFHFHNANDATLAVRNRETSRYFIFNDDNLLCGWCNKQDAEEKIVRKSTTYKYLAFSGIHLINRDLAKEINSVEKSSITNYYLEKAHNKNIRAYIHNLDLWEDIGKFETFKDRLS